MNVEHYNIVFMGTPTFAADILLGLLKSKKCNIASVYTMPDAVRGRGKKLVPSCVKTVALDNGLCVETPKNFKDNSDIEKLKSFNPDLIIVAAYGMLLPKVVLDIPKYGCINVHGSLLPKWRGAAPLQRSILAGDKYTGISLMKMEEGLDTGDFCIQKRIEIGNKNLNQLYSELSGAAVDVLDEFFGLLSADSVEWTSQNHSCATYADKVEKKELWINEQDSAHSALKKIKASSSQSPAKCNIFGKNVRIIDADIIDGNLEILSIRPDGKNEMDWDSFIRGIQNYSEGPVEWKSIE